MALFPGTRIATFLICSAVAQGAALELRQTRYELQAGKPAALAASPETMEFLLGAKSRSVEIDGTPAGGLVAGPNRARDQVLLAASARLKPGAHTVKLTAVSDTGEERVAAFDVVVDALQTVPNNATRPPVVLLNGWETGYTGVCNIASASLDTFGNLANYLVSDGVPVVYLFDNCAEDPNQSIETLGNDLGVFLNSIQSRQWFTGAADRPGGLQYGRGADRPKATWPGCSRKRQACCSSRRSIRWCAKWS